MAQVVEFNTAHSSIHMSENNVKTAHLLARLGITSKDHAAIIHVFETFERSVDATFKEEDRETIYQALYLSSNVHAEQRRKDGEPYIEHPVGVAQRVIELCATPDKDAVVTALLHDVIEDQSTRVVGMYGERVRGDMTTEEQALQTLGSKFGHNVARYLKMLTNPDFTAILAQEGIDPSSPNFLPRKRELYAQHVAEIIQDPTVCLVKFADFSQNGLDLAAMPDGEEKTHLALKYRPVMDAFVSRIDDTSRPLNTTMQAAMLTELQDSMRYVDNFVSSAPSVST